MDWIPARQAVAERLKKAWLGIAFMLVAALAFEAGMLQRGLSETDPVIIAEPSPLPGVAAPEHAAVRQTPAAQALDTPVDPSGSCVYVGSKKSNKYHRPSSRCAKQIKSENRLCFASEEAARAKNYLPGCLE
ncbi:MAG: hypothetical protein WBO92_00335 [Candidatus Moraniibacteriota bacterium]